MIWQVFLLMSCCGTAFYGYFFAFHLLHITENNQLLRRVILAVTRNGMQRVIHQVSYFSPFNGLGIGGSKRMFFFLKRTWSWWFDINSLGKWKSLIHCYLHLSWRCALSLWWHANILCLLCPFNNWQVYHCCGYSSWDWYSSTYTRS